ncbi:MAG: molybdate ABC transporter substrate-binding protein [Thermomicrobiales bacterium]
MRTSSTTTSVRESRQRTVSPSGFGIRTAFSLLLMVLSLAFVAAPVAPVAAQDAAIACAPATPAASSATAAASPVAATPAEFPADGGTLTVFAAASLTDAFATIVTDIQAAHPNVTITVETGGSQALVTQLTEGAKADVLATANTSTMKDAQEAGLIDGTPTIFTGNRLVIVTPDGNPAGITSLDDLARSGLKLVIAGSDVPVGSYTRKTLCSYVAKGDAPEGFLDAVNANVVSQETDVRSVLAKVQLGEADAGIVYASDAVASNLAGTNVGTVEFPFETTATYPIAPVTGGNTALAQAFITYVLSPEGQKVLADYGFAPAGS